MAPRLITAFLIFALSALSPADSTAREWTILGPRALGMGGANVAVANDATATYWNPGAYGFFNRIPGGDYGNRRVSGVLPFGAGMEVHEGLGAELDKIFQIDFNKFSGGTVAAADVPEFLSLINSLKTFDDNPDRALTVNVNGGLLLQASRLGLGGLLLSEISARGDLDLVNIGPVAPGTTFTLNDFTNPANYGCSPCAGGTYLSTSDKAALDSFLTGLGWTASQRTDYINAIDYGLTQANSAGETIPADVVTMAENAASLATAASGGGSLSDNTSRLLFKGIAVAEFPLTYGYPLTDYLAVGGSVKFMKARVYNTFVDVFNTDFSNALSAARTDYTESNNYGIDLGVLYRGSDKLRLGVVARNVNSPEFDMKRLLPGDEDSLKEKVQVRAGVAVKPLSFVTVALDYDLTENDTTVSDGFKSRHLGGGVEVDISRVLQVRAGAYKDTARGDIGPVYTAGLGLNLWIVNIDAGASVSENKTTVDGDEIPGEVKAELALSTLF